MPKVVVLTGQRFGRLTVIGDSGERDKNGSIYWKCKCDCGNETKVVVTALRAGATKSCGCLWKEAMAARNLNDNPRIDNSSTGIKNISYKPKQVSECYCVSITRDKRVYSQYFSTLQEAERAKEYVLSRYKKGLSNWNDKL